MIDSPSMQPYGFMATHENGLANPGDQAVERPDPLIIDNLVLPIDPYLRPSYRISPFRTGDIAFFFNLDRESDSTTEIFLNRHFGTSEWGFTRSGRQALRLSLEHYSLRPTDCVTILTSSDNLYISRCVTKTIESHCTWSRKFEPSTRLILVNHEFGIPYPDLESLPKLGYPIIEDCAHSFFSQNERHSVGTIGDFVIYSLPKIFPVQMGGILRSNHEYPVPKPCDHLLNEYLSLVIGTQVTQTATIVSRRRTNHQRLVALLAPFGCTARFAMCDTLVPGVCMLRLPPNINKAALKSHYQNNGVECSIFYGEDAFFLPVHHRLDEADLRYFAVLYKLFLQMAAHNDLTLPGY